MLLHSSEVTPTQIGSLSAVIKILNTLSEFNTHDVGDPVGISQQLSTERPEDWRCYHIATSTYQQHVMDRQADTTDKWTNSYMYVQRCYHMLMNVQHSNL